MKKMNSSYRLQIIKEVAQRRQHLKAPDEMSLHITHVLEHKDEQPKLSNTPFPDAHFDDNAGGWVNDRWGSIK